jgi:hypothetical protein
MPHDCFLNVWQEAWSHDGVGSHDRGPSHKRGPSQVAISAGNAARDKTVART